MAHKPLLKQFGDLTRADFAKHPVWASVHTLDFDEVWYDETDEETFRPWTGPLPVGPEEGMLLVRARFTLADGRALDGFLTPQTEAEPLSLGAIQPQLFLPSGKRCDFWDGMFKRQDEDRKMLYLELGEESSDHLSNQVFRRRGASNWMCRGIDSRFLLVPEGHRPDLPLKGRLSRLPHLSVTG